mmetsp:Transcript_15576/g.47025  ORF Transcript_15576/g.47025 Transcript_15576/m.47025 type:complete len:368 (+) Transcript_15576:133-1236(+)
MLLRDLAISTVAQAPRTGVTSLGRLVSRRAVKRRDSRVISATLDRGPRRLAAAAAGALTSPHDSSRSLLMEHEPAVEHRAQPVLAAESAKSSQKTPRGNALPSPLHAKVAAAKGRLVIVGDVHGCLDELQALLKQVRFREGGNQGDTLVLVGDLVNKGPHSAAVVATVRQLGALCVRGNHDDSALEAYRQHAAGKKVKDKHAWVRGLTSADAAWIAQLPFSLRLRRTLCIVHAGLVPDVKLKRQNLQNLYTMRDLKHTKTGWRASTAHDGRPWAPEWHGSPMARHIFFGHDAQRRLQLCKFATGLDTGCVYGGALTACVIPAGERLPWWAEIRGAFMRLMGHGKRPLTLKELGGTIVSVPSQQPVQD